MIYSYTVRWWLRFVAHLLNPNICVHMYMVLGYENSVTNNMRDRIYLHYCTWVVGIFDVRYTREINASHTTWPFFTSQHEKRCITMSKLCHNTEFLKRHLTCASFKLYTTLVTWPTCLFTVKLKHTRYFQY